MLLRLVVAAWQRVPAAAACLQLLLCIPASCRAQLCSWQHGYSTLVTGGAKLRLRLSAVDRGTALCGGLAALERLITA